MKKTQNNLYLLYTIFCTVLVTANAIPAKPQIANTAPTMIIAIFLPDIVFASFQ